MRLFHDRLHTSAPNEQGALACPMAVCTDMGGRTDTAKGG